MKKIFTLLLFLSMTYLASAQCPNAYASPAAQTICSGQDTGIFLTSNQSGTTYSWTCTQSGVTGASAGSGEYIIQQLTTNGSSQGTATYTVTPVANSCTGVPITVTISVTPTPVGTATPSTQTICSGETTNIVLSSNVPGTTYHWNLLQVNVTGGNEGSGNVIQQTLTATGSYYPGEAVFMVTPHTNGCPGSAIEVRITVYPNPNPTITDGVICVDQSTGNSFTTYTLDTGLSNSAYDFVWNLDGVTIAGAVGNTYEASYSGTYSVQVTDATTGCISSLVYANVNESYPADTMNLSQYQETNGSITVTVDVSGGISNNLLYQMDSGTIQSSNVFYNVSSGSHTFHVTDYFGCTDLTMTTQVLSNNEFNTINLVYNPNPVSDILTITAKETLKKATVFNTLGQVVYSKLFNELNPKLELSNLVSGNYFVKVEADNKQNVFKIIKK